MHCAHRIRIGKRSPREMRSSINRYASRRIPMQLQGAVDEPISCDAFIVAQPRGLRNRYAARYSRESLLSKHEEAGALRVNVNRQGEARSTSGKNGARG